MTSRRPIIGVTLDYSSEHRDRYMLPQDYASSIERAGGLPLAIPFKTDLSLVPEIVDALDGVLFTGGDDLDPALYGEAWHPSASKSTPPASGSNWPCSPRSSAAGRRRWASASARSS